MNTQIQQDELELPIGRIYFDDIIKTDEFGLFKNLDALLLWASENPADVSGYSGRTYLRSYRTARGNLGITFICADIDECDCSWQVAMRQYDKDKEQGETNLTEPDFDTTPRKQVDCEVEIEIDYEYVELGVMN
jgi:hypothetical protein